MSKKSLILKGMIILAGLGGGYLYYHFIGCQNGYCPISSNPYISIIYGGVIGLLLALSLTSRKRKNA
jgi:hypothetical protein